MHTLFAGVRLTAILLTNIIPRGGSDSFFVINMRQCQLNRTLKLVRRTGDKLIILDQDSDEAFVIMDLDNYENILDVADFSKDLDPVQDENENNGNDESCDDLNCDCHSSTEESDPLGDYVLDDELETEEQAKKATVSDVSESIAVVKSTPTVEEPIVVPITSNFASPQTSATAEESLSDVPHETEEETFLLEPVE